MTGPARHASDVLLRAQRDERLVSLTRGGDERAFAEIVRRYRRALVAHCARVLPRERAEDAVQQALLRAYEAIRKGDAELKLRPWLYRIAQNSALNALRQRGFDHDPLSEHIDGVERPPEAFERSESVREIVAAVKDLPPRQRDALVLREFEGRSYADIAGELEVSDGAVRQLLSRARSALRGAITALTPPGLLMRLAHGGDGRLAQKAADAGGALTAVKLTAGVLAAGGLVAGAPLVIHGGVDRGAAGDGTRATMARPAPARPHDLAARRAIAAAAPVAGRPRVVTASIAHHDVPMRHVDLARSNPPGRAGDRSDRERRDRSTGDSHDAAPARAPTLSADRFDGPSQAGMRQADGSAGTGDRSGQGEASSGPSDGRSGDLGRRTSAG